MRSHSRKVPWLEPGWRTPGHLSPVALKTSHLSLQLCFPKHFRPGKGSGVSSPQPGLSHSRSKPEGEWSHLQFSRCGHHLPAQACWGREDTACLCFIHWLFLHTLSSGLGQTRSRVPGPGSRVLQWLRSREACGWLSQT